MIKNFLAVAVRNFLRQKFYSFINVIGLATGLACALCIYLWVSDETGMDKFHKNIDNIYQILSNIRGDGEILTWNVTPGPLVDEIKSSIPEVVYSVRLSNDGDQLFQYEDKNQMEAGYFGDSDFFKIFSFKIVAGNTSTPLPDKKSVVISQRLAIQLFGQEDPIGKVVKVAQKYDQIVTAVMEDSPANSSIKTDFIMPFEIHRDYRPSSWGNSDYITYVTLQENADPETVMNKINAHVKKILDPDNKQGAENLFFMQPFAERYLHAHFENGKPVGGRIEYVKIFTIVAIFILIIACINFMNMATARAATRAKEVGVRKVVGAQRWSLITQFISEAMFITTLGMLVAIGIVYSILPLFNNLVGKSISLTFDPQLIITILIIILATGLLSGSYPAFFLTSLKPAGVLKGTKVISGNSNLRKGLVIFQFALTVMLIASAMVVYNQIEFIQNKNLGYNRNSILTFSARGTVNSNFEAFRNEAMKNSAIVNLTRANQSLVQVNNQTSSVSWPGKADGVNQYFRAIVVDYDFLNTLGFEVVEGRLFSREHNDTSTYVITQNTADIMGLKDPVGQTISLWGTPGTVIGVVNDFHSRSLHEAMDPIVFYCKPQWTRLVYAQVDPAKPQEAIDQLQRTYTMFSPEYSFDYQFMDDAFEKQYQSEKITGTLALSFTVMAVIISGLGLLGLAAYTAERRKKEISIRKTLGASVASLISMMSKEFLRLSIIAAIIGCPVAYYLMDKFLQGYAYHTQLGWAVFVYTAVAVTVLSITIVIVQIGQAAMANPVDSLRNE